MVYIHRSVCEESLQTNMSMSDENEQENIDVIINQRPEKLYMKCLLLSFYS